MVNAQQWLDAKYPTQGRNQITELNISEKNLAGDLKLEGFINLEDFDCSSNQLTSLDLSDCSNLKKFTCSFNFLTNLNLVNLTKLESLWCSTNLLARIDYPVADPSNRRQLMALGVSNNNFPTQDLTVFSRFTNLRHLHIGNSNQISIDNNVYNRWVGSLEPLQNLTNLMMLDISNTDLNSGVEYLPARVSLIEYSAWERPQSQVREIAWQLSLRESKSQSEWEKLGFTLPEIRDWIKVGGLVAKDYDLANYLKNMKNLSPSMVGSSLSRLKEEFEENQFQTQIENPPQVRDNNT